MRLKNFSFLLALAGLILFSGTSFAGDNEKKQLQTLLNDKHPHIVSIKAVIQQEMSGGGQSRSNERKQTIRGVLIDDRGTILTSSTLFASQSSSFRGQSFKVENTPKQLDVILEEDSEEQDAFLGATDDRFGLAFLQLKNPDEASFVPLDLGSATRPEIGQEAVWVSRKAKAFDYAPFFTAAMINGKISKPRNMWGMQGAGPAGLPVFSLDGSLLGVTVSIDADAGSGRAQLRRMLSGGAGGNNFLMPISDLKKVLRRARKQIKSTRKKIEEQEKENDDANDENSNAENDEG